MLILVVLLFICVALAAVVVGLVAIPAHRQGREILSPEGEEVVAGLRERTGAVVEAARVSRERRGRADTARHDVDA